MQPVRGCDVSALPTRERIEELQRAVAHRPGVIARPFGSVDIKESELLALLDAALTMRRLEEHIADPAIRESFDHEARVAARMKWGDLEPTWFVQLRAQTPYSHASGPNLLTAISAALDAAEAKEPVL